MVRHHRSCWAEAVAVLVLLSVNVQESLTRSTGPPAAEPEYHDQVCNQMIPNHAQVDPQPGNGGYLIDTDLSPSPNSATAFEYSEGRTYKVKIVGTTNTFRGFLVIAHVPGHNDTLLGRFIPQNSSQQTLSCDELGMNNDSSIGHSNAGPTVDFQSMDLLWQAPNQNNGTVDFRYTVVHNFSTFYVHQSAAQNVMLEKQTPPDPTTTANSISPQTASSFHGTTTNFPPTSTFFEATTNSQSVPTISSTTTDSSLVSPTRNLEDYRLTFHNPPLCKPSECDMFVGIDNHMGNSSFLDIYLEGEANGWVAVGFSKTHSMFAADVVGCNRDPNTDEVEAVDAWTSAIQTAERRVTVDPNTDVVRFSSSYNDGRISCSVAKKIAPTDSAHDLNLDSQLYVMFGRRKGNSEKDEMFPHETGPGEIPILSNELLNPLTLSASLDDSYPRAILLRAHGIIMIITWALLATTGIFFATWMKTALPKGEWFQVHRAFLLASLFLGAAGFVLPFAADYHRVPHGLLELGRGNPVGTSHFTVGVVVMLLQIINPVIAAFRCKPDVKRHWIFKILHGILLGKVVHLLAMLNLCLGAFAMFKNSTPLLWLCVSYSAFVIIFNFSLFVLLRCVCRICNNAVRRELVSQLAMNNRQLLLFSDDEEDEVEECDDELTAFDGSLKDSLNPEVSRIEMTQKQTSKTSSILWISLTLYLAISLPLIVAMVALAAVQV